MENTRVNLSKEKLEPEGEHQTVSDPIDYCEVCYIAFGSQEYRIKKNGKTVHVDCAELA
ncbi:MAG: hypothetical protein ACOC5U_01685 [Candidatus Aminicenantaceae bacterium]